MNGTKDVHRTVKSVAKGAKKIIMHNISYKKTQIKSGLKEKCCIFISKGQ
jgi:hypothetical protein